ncbi:hypothetical protein Peur_002465 [Populus x canadensis]
MPIVEFSFVFLVAAIKQWQGQSLFRSSSLPPTSPAFTGLLFSTNEIVAKRRGLRLDRICCRFSAPLLNRDGEDARLFPSNGAVSAETGIFTLIPASGNLTIGSQIIYKSFNFAIEFISPKSLKYSIVYKIVLNSWIVQFGP